MNIGASSVTALHRTASAIQAFGQACRRASEAMPGRAAITSRRARREEQRLSQQDQAVRNLQALRRRKVALLTEQQILIAEIADAKRWHKATSSAEAALRAVVTELLSIG